MATAAGAAALHRYAASQTTGSGGATTFLQTSSTASALQGEVASSANPNIKIPFGMLGEYNAAGSTFGIGVAGISTTGYAVGAEALGVNPAVLALNAGTGDGLDAYADGAAPAIYAESETGTNAILAVGDKGDGTDSYESTDYAAALYGVDQAPDSGYGVYGVSGSTSGFGSVGISVTGTGVYGESESGSNNPSFLAYTSTSNTELFDADVEGTDGNTYPSTTLTFPSQNYSGEVTSSVSATNDLQLAGDLLLSGSIFTDCKTFPETTPSKDCSDLTDSVARTSSGRLVKTYGSHHTSPTLEDEGEAHLTNGYAHVTLDSAFASSISMRTPYLVFTTPQGDGPGLFVTKRTASGFDVRQSLGGRSNMLFDYRIVAHPYGRDNDRIAIVAPAPIHQRPISPSLAHGIHAIRDFHTQHRRTKRPAPRSLIVTSR